MDVRIIDATNRDLRREVRKGRFREDLFYRLNVVTIELPPLRERGQDLPEQVQFFLGRYCRDTGRPPLHLAQEVERAFLQYKWPGNVRQLQITIERAVVLSRGPIITAEALPPELLSDRQAQRRADPASESFEFPLFDAEMPMTQAVELFLREKLWRALAETNGVKAQAAIKLVPHVTNFSRLLRRLGLFESKDFSSTQ